jgi:hypothetical protein
MVANKKSVFIFLPCFLIALVFFTPLWAQKGSNKTPLDQTKSENKQEPAPSLTVNAPSLTINGAKIEIVPKKKTSEKQKAESTQGEVSTKNQAQISLDSTHYDAGEIWEGEEIVHTFTVKNIGTAQLIIKKVEAG